MVIDEKTIFRLPSPESYKNKNFGTGFAVAYKDRHLFILTCAHVVEKLNGSVKINGCEADIVAIGSAESVDLALLRIPCEQPPPLQNHIVKGERNKKIQLRGFSFLNKTYELREIEGKLGKNSPRQSKDSYDLIPTWDLHIEDDDFCKLKGGYSGSPLCDEDGRLIGVVSERVNDGQRGHAVAIGNLKTIYPNIEQLVPSFADLNNDDLDAESRIRRVRNQLSGRSFEIFEVMQNIGQELGRMEKEGIRTEDEKIFEKIEGFVGQAVGIEEFISFFKKLDSRKRATDIGPNYKKLAARLRKGCVVLCLGQELSPLLGASVPSTEQIINSLVEKQEFRGPLSEICEQEEISPDCGRYELVEKIRTMLKPAGITSIALYELLARLENPLLIISAAYDDLLEQSLKGKRKFVVIYPDIKQNNCLLSYSDQRKIFPCTSEKLSHQELLAEGYIVIYRLRGGFIDHDRETLLLSERDYFTFNRSMQYPFPDYISNRLKKHTLWFLGHHPQSWEERLLVKSLLAQRDRRNPSLAVQKNIPPFACAFWKDNNVQGFDLAPIDFIQELEKAAAS
jgi:hypothetical protein